MSKSPSLRRIQADIRELALDPSDQYYASPIESDLFEWHFTIRGASGTDFEGGIYHGRILLPADYPFKAPHIMFLTPSGRFEVNTKICLSFTAFHNELWQPAWGIRLILEALISFLPAKGDGAIGALDWKPEERKRLAKKSVDFVCPTCGNCCLIMKNLMDRIEQTNKKKEKGSDTVDGPRSCKFREEIEKLHALQIAAERIREDKEKNVDGMKNEQVEQNVDGMKEEQEAGSESDQTLSPKLQSSKGHSPQISNENDVVVEKTDGLIPEETTWNEEAVSDPNSPEIDVGDTFVPLNDLFQEASDLMSNSMANVLISGLFVVIATLLYGIIHILIDLKKLEEEFRHT